MPARRLCGRTGVGASRVAAGSTSLPPSLTSPSSCQSSCSESQSSSLSSVVKAAYRGKGAAPPSRSDEGRVDRNITGDEPLSSSLSIASGEPETRPVAKRPTLPSEQFDIWEWQDDRLLVGRTTEERGGYSSASSGSSAPLRLLPPRLPELLRFWLLVKGPGVARLLLAFSVLLVGRLLRLLGRLASMVVVVLLLLGPRLLDVEDVFKAKL